MGKYTYSDPEKGLLKVMEYNRELSLNLQKSQRNDVQKPAQHCIDESIALLKSLGYDTSVQASSKPVTAVKPSLSVPPHWSSLVKEATASIPSDVQLKDLLSETEFRQAYDHLADIENEFNQKTHLDKTDSCFLIVATALQVIRRIVFPKAKDILNKLRITDKQGDKLVKKQKEEFDKFGKNSGWSTEKNTQGNFPRKQEGKSWREIIFSSVPYDATRGAALCGVNMEGGYHRYKTLGHDPILGWLFGTMNILTDTLTLNSFVSYRIQQMRFTPEIVSMPQVISETMLRIKEDYHRLPAAIFRQAIHYQSDAFTKRGLPIPLLGTFSESLAGELYREQYDSLCFTADTALPAIINMLIGLIHGLGFNPEKGVPRKLYEVKTRKILFISNSIASTSNLIEVAVLKNPYKLDIGGIIVTLSRLFSDVRFIARIKEEFINQKLNSELYEQLRITDQMYNNICF